VKAIVAIHQAENRAEQRNCEVLAA